MIQKTLYFFVGLSVCLFLTGGENKYWEIDYARARIAFHQGLYEQALDILSNLRDHQEAALLEMKIMKKTRQSDFFSLKERYEEQWGKSFLVRHWSYQLFFDLDDFSGMQKLYKDLDRPLSIDHFFAGIAFMEKGQTIKAKQHFSLAEDNPLLIKPIENYLSEKKAEQPIDIHELIPDDLVTRTWSDEAPREILPGKYSLFLSLGSGYSDNVAFQPADKTIDYIFRDKKDFYSFLFLWGIYELYRDEKYLVSVSAGLYHSYHYDLSEFDLTAVISSLNIYRFLRSMEEHLKLSFLPAYYWLDKDSFLRVYGAKASWKKQWNDTHTSQLAYLFEDKTFFDNKARNAYYHELQYSHKVSLSNTSALGASAVFGINDATWDYDYKRYGINMYASHFVTDKNQIKIGSEISRNKYDNQHSVFNIRRQDTIYQPYADYFYYFRPDIFANIRYSWRRNDSKISFYDYRKNTIQASINVMF